MSAFHGSSGAKRDMLKKIRSFFKVIVWFFCIGNDRHNSFPAAPPTGYLKPDDLKHLEIMRVLNQIKDKMPSHKTRRRGFR